MYNVQDIEGEQIIMIVVDEVHVLRLPSKPNVKSFAKGKKNTQIGFRYYDVILCYQFLSDSTLTTQQWHRGMKIDLKLNLPEKRRGKLLNTYRGMVG